MNDFDYECLQRKNLARQAKYKKNGSKSRKCSLPSDRMTKKQWKERCGPVNTYRLGAPMCWDDFKNMPERYQAEYITNLQTKYGASAVDLSDMFGVSARSVRSYLSANVSGVKLKRGNVMSAQKRTEWKMFLGETESDPEAHEEVVVPEELAVICDEDFSVVTDLVENVAEPQTSAEEVITNHTDEDSSVAIDQEPAIPASMVVSQLHLKLSGRINIDMLSCYLKRVLGDGGDCDMEIICNFK